MPVLGHVHPLTLFVLVVFRVEPTSLPSLDTLDVYHQDTLEVFLVVLTSVRIIFPLTGNIKSKQTNSCSVRVALLNTGACK